MARSDARLPLSGDVYQGTYRQDGREAIVTINGQPLDPRFDLGEFSTAGFNWGYGGAGPSQLALAILADTAGDGTAETYWPLFKSEVIARLDFGQPFVLTAAEIHAFLKAKQVFLGGGEAA